MEAIIFKDINDKFAYGMYLDIEVIIMKENGYINATRLCSDISKIIGKDKRFRDWKRISTTQDYINVIDSDLKQQAMNLAGSIIENNKTPFEENYLRGHYIHRYLITHLASWISPLYGLKVSKIVDEYYINKYNKISKEEKEIIITPYIERINRLEEIIDEKENEIERKNTFLIEQLELLIVSRINKTQYYFNRIQTIRQKKTLKTNEDRGYIHIKTIPLSRNSVFVFNKMIKDLEIKKTYNIVTYEEPIENLIEEIENYIETYN